MTDKGLKEAIRKQTTFSLPSNFNYRMMQKIEEQARLREERREKRICIVTILTITAMITGSIGFICWHYNALILSFCRQLSTSIPDGAFTGFYLPTMFALVLLACFNHWLRKRLFHSI